MITPAPMARESADQYVDRLAAACKLKGLVTEIIEPSTKLKIGTLGGHALMAETISLRPDVSEALTWHWSWGAPICPADDIDYAVRSIFHVISDRLG
jgi:hypothetical protein